MKVKGFTLVELLAVIVILAIVLAIAVPGISGIIQNSARGALQSDVKMILGTVDCKLLEDSSFDPSTVNETNANTLLNIDSSNYQTLTIKKINDEYHVTIVGKNKWANLTASGTKFESNVTDTVTTLSNGANKPVLFTGMTPIKWNGSAWVATTESDSSWYNYDTTSKQWANARTADGSMWVWIPRYVYRIPTANWHTSTSGTIDVQFTRGVDDNWNKAVIGNIDVGETANASNNKWTNHPAFTFGDTELTGIWVAKFEPSGTTSAIDSKPNVATLSSLTINGMFTSSRDMETNDRYGWGTTGKGIDTHMMKNVEWGAIAYLTQSTYGKNAELYINNSNTYTTGCSGGSTSAAEYAGCQYTYDTVNGQGASTTGNIYGIYDISGGAWEYLAAYVDNGHTNLDNGSNVVQASNKYKDVYAKATNENEGSNYDLTINKKGDALYETSSSGSESTSWYEDYSYMVRTDEPWFRRGSNYSSGDGCGIYNFYHRDGDETSSTSFRPVLVVGTGL